MVKLSAAERRAAQAVYYKAWYVAHMKAFAKSRGKTYTPRFVWRYATEAERRERERQDAARG